MKKTHSPGPWEVWAGTIINDANGVLVGSVKEATGAISNCDIDTARANARLMGAAPDLLAAAEAAEQLLRDVAIADSGDPEQDAFEREAHANLLAAIKKAKGE